MRPRSLHISINFITKLGIRMHAISFAISYWWFVSLLSVFGGLRAYYRMMKNEQIFNFHSSN